MDEIDNSTVPVLTAIIANRMDGIVKEISNTLLRAARSGVINSARDFSCSIVTSNNELLSAAEGLPVHVFGSHLQCMNMAKVHADFAEGDAFLHNDPYSGNTHAADHTTLVPVFFEGEHMFTVCVKAHQADIGNSIPTTYFAAAKDVYEEGALIFPCVRIQRDYKTIDDIVRMCALRIRVPEQWRGDFLAALGAARVGERRLKEVCKKYGKEQIKEFIVGWMDYAERRMAQAIHSLPKAELENSTTHDPFEGIVPEGIPINIKLSIDPEEAMIEIDLRDNVDCVDCGLNQSEACAINNVITGVFNSLDPDIPHNSGAFRRLRVLLRDNCVVGRPKFPHSCSMATTNVADRLINVTQSAFAKLGDGHGLAEGGLGMGAGTAVLSGADFRRGGAPFVNQIFVGTPGGPASSQADGWVTWGIPVAAGVMYRDSVEICELKQPIQFLAVRLASGRGGAGKYRGSPGVETVYGPKKDPVTVIIPCDGQIYPPKGVLGGEDSPGTEVWKIDGDGASVKLPNATQPVLQPGELIRGIDNCGGGYGNPLEREPERVRQDVLEGWETSERARQVYGVVLGGSIVDETLHIDEGATIELRAELGGQAS